LVYKILFDDRVVKDLKKIDQLWQKKILTAINVKLPNNPYLGKKLVGDLSSFYRLRVGDFRVIYQVINQELIVTIIKVRHRKEVYKN
jgi:mRNA interferase RelE/StbE